MAEALLSEDLPDAVFGAAKAGPGMWASLVRVIEPIQGKTLHTIHLDQNEAAFRWVNVDGLEKMYSLMDRSIVKSCSSIQLL